MVLYTIKNIFPITDIVKTLPSNGINNYIKMCKDNALEKQQWGTKQKWKKIKLF